MTNLHFTHKNLQPRKLKKKIEQDHYLMLNYHPDARTPSWRAYDFVSFHRGRNSEKNSQVHRL